MMQVLNLQPLINATTRLQEGWLRYLEQVSANPVEFDQMSFQDLIRTANEQSLLQGDWADWKQYRDMRRRTSHTYDEAVALAVVQGIEKFLAEAVFLQNKLQQKTVE